MNLTKWLINRVMQSFPSVLPNIAAISHSKVGVVEVPPTFWAETLTPGGVSDEIVSGEVIMKRANRLRVPDPINLVKKFSCPDVSGIYHLLWPTDWWLVRCTNFVPTRELFPHFYPLEVFGCCCSCYIIMPVKQFLNISYWTLLLDFCLCGRLLWSAFKPTGNLASNFLPHIPF